MREEGPRRRVVLLRNNAHPVGKGRGAGREEGAGVAGGHGEERAGGRLKTRLTVGSHLAERERGVRCG